MEMRTLPDFDEGDFWFYKREEEDLGYGSLKKKDLNCFAWHWYYGNRDLYFEEMVQLDYTLEEITKDPEMLTKFQACVALPKSSMVNKGIY